MFRIALAQMEVIPGRPDLNSRSMLRMMEAARMADVQMIVFPELALPGHSIGNLWQQPEFLADCQSCADDIIHASINIIAVFGNVYQDWDGNSPTLRNACYIAQNGRLLGKTIFKQSSKEDDLNSEYFSCKRQKEIPVLLHPSEEETCRVSFHIGTGPDGLNLPPGSRDMVVCIDAAPFRLGEMEQKKAMLSRTAKEAGVPLVYVNCVGMQNDNKAICLYPGGSAFFDAKGHILAKDVPYQEELIICDPAKDAPLPKTAPKDEFEPLYQAIVYGIRHFSASIGMEKAVIGLSGGIDSALSACLYEQAIGAEHVLLVNMPGPFSSKSTRDLAGELAANLGCHYAIAPIDDVVRKTTSQIEDTVITNMKGGVTWHLRVSSSGRENIQARDRGSRLLAGMAAAWDCGFVCNGNKSELTAGYFTLYGDGGGFLAPLGDLWKYQVYGLANYMNRHIYKREMIPHGIFDLHPSAELSSSQDVEKGQGDPFDYDYHDYLFSAFVEKSASPETILRWYLADELDKMIGAQPGTTARVFPVHRDFVQDLECWWEKYSGIAAGKRAQAPPVLSISNSTFGNSRTRIQTGPYYTRAYQDMRKRIDMD